MRDDITLAIYGATIGDLWGSRWEFDPRKPKSLDEALELRVGSEWTDDTIMTAALAEAICEWKHCENAPYSLSMTAQSRMREYGGRYNTSYGARFAMWLSSPDPKPYDSLGNGAAMRVSPAGLAAKTLEEAISLSDSVTCVTHNHPEGMECARAVAALVFLAKDGKTKDEMRKHLKDNHKEIFSMISGMSLEGLHESYSFTETSIGTVPQAIWCFLSSDSFEDCLARSIYVGGDSDTLAAISCSIAAAFYGDSQTYKFVRKAIARMPSGIDASLMFFSHWFLRYNPKQDEKTKSLE